MINRLINVDFGIADMRVNEIVAIIRINKVKLDKKELIEIKLYQNI